MTRSVHRRQVLAYRAFAQGLHRDADGVGALEVLDLGVQDTPPGSATHALANRLGDSRSEAVRIGELSTTWTVRGAPHVHRAGDLVALSRALWPCSDEDALARLDTSSSPVRASGMPPREALRLVAEHVAEIVTRPMPKGEVSAALTPRVPPAMTVDCRPCGATHIAETLFRSAVLPAGITFDPDQRAVTFVAMPDWPGVPPEAIGVEHVIASYLRLLGPATAVEVAAFLGTTPSEVTSRWPNGLAEIDVGGRRGWIPEEAVEALRSPPEPPAVRLLPPSDPLLQARDRELLVPDPERRKALWPILGRPGALLVEGEVAGLWRARKKGRRLDVTVQPFGRLAPAIRLAIEAEAVLAAEARGVDDAAVTVE